MSPSVGDMLSLVTDYASDYVQWFETALVHPSRLETATEAKSPRLRKVSLVGRLAVFLALSIFIGATVGALIPNRPQLADRATIAVVVSLLWVFLSLIIHAFCKLLRGSGSIGMTMTAMMRTLAVVYVISNFATLLLTGLAKVYAPLGEKLADTYQYGSSGAILFTCQFLLLLIYVPLALRGVHGFRGIRGVILAVAGAGCAILFGIPVFAMHGC